ncbi:MAG: hypothetical protein JST54_21075 [Deltaproteobacteria bacterium]|nr:hypothetical protein [Deltaproteobacteria bacterium]
MPANRKKLVAGLVLLLAVAFVAAWVFRKPAASEQDERDADAALQKLDPHSARQSLAQRCKLPPRPDDGVAMRACAALHDLSILEGKPLDGAARLSELAHVEPSPGARPVLEDVQVLRVELLLEAGHSREAAHEAQAWAEAHGDDETVGAVRLWVAAMHAQRAIGYEQQAGDDARRAIHLASKVTH